MIDTTDNFLEHYGKKGMKWGVRKSGAKANRSSSRTVFEKSPKRLSSHELESRIKRMEMEKKYNDLNKRDISKGTELASKLLTNTGTKVAATVLTGASLYGIKKLIERKMGSEAASMITKRGK